MTLSKKFSYRPISQDEGSAGHERDADRDSERGSPHSPLHSRDLHNRNSRHYAATSTSGSSSLARTSIIDARAASELAREADAHAGVRRVEAASHVYGRYSRWVLFGSLGLASYIYSLDASTTSSYLSFAASEFGEHALISALVVAQSVIVAVGKPVIAKVADVTSRAYAYMGVLIFYVIGYILVASAQSIRSVAGGIITYAVGYTGLQLLTQIIIADSTTLKWRALVSSLTSLPFILNGFVGPEIASAILERSGWRWGYAMFAILVPSALLPLILTLFWAERKAKRLGIVDEPEDDDNQSIRSVEDLKPSLWKRFLHSAEQLDLLGLILLGSSIAFILLPLTLANKSARGWSNPVMITMLVVGIALLSLFGIWDLRFASRPVIAPRFVRNRSVIIAGFIGLLDFLSYFLTYVYLLSFVLVVKPWTTLQANLFLQVQTIALTVFGCLAGIIMWYTRRFKIMLVGGLLVRLLGCALMIHSRGAHASNAEIVWTQVLQGAGGFTAVASQVGAQASVPHADVAMVTAVVLLMTEIGGAVGSALAGAIWSGSMPKNLEKALPQLGESERQALFGSIMDVLKYPRGHPIREGVIAAYDETMKVMVIAATLISIVPIILSLGMPDWYLGDTQNAVMIEDEDGDEPLIGGSNSDEDDSDSSDETERNTSDRGDGGVRE